MSASLSSFFSFLVPFLPPFPLPLSHRGHSPSLLKVFGRCIDSSLSFSFSSPLLLCSNHSHSLKPPFALFVFAPSRITPFNPFGRIHLHSFGYREDPTVPCPCNSDLTKTDWTNSRPWGSRLDSASARASRVSISPDFGHETPHTGYSTGRPRPLFKSTPHTLLAIATHCPALSCHWSWERHSFSYLYYLGLYTAPTHSQYHCPRRLRVFHSIDTHGD